MSALGRVNAAECQCNFAACGDRAGSTLTGKRYVYVAFGSRVVRKFQA